MPAQRQRPTQRLEDLGLASLALAALCCAGLPALGALVGGVTIAALLGIGAGVLFVAALLAVGIALPRVRRRRYRERRR